jgi:hypothetical protein
MIRYFKCCRCEQAFICSEIQLPETLICGGGCGGFVEEITEEQALELTDRARESMRYGRRED